MTTKIAYCTSCGSKLVERPIEGRQRKQCPECGRVVYRNPKPCAGVLVVDGERLLLVKRSNPPAVGSWSVPAGYLEYDEPPEAGAVRELAEETGIQTTESALDLFDTAFVQHPDDQYILVILYVVSRDHVEGIPEAGDDADAARFWTLDGIDEQEEQVEPGYRDLFSRAVQAVN
ncbi:MAG: NUDIX domain-containing protein [Halobacteriales archaeon]